MRQSGLFIATSALFALSSSLAADGGLFYTNTDLPKLDNHPANNWRSCNAESCIQRLVVEVEHGRYQYSSKPPECIAKEDSDSLFSTLMGSSGSGAAEYGQALDLVDKIAKVATEKGIIRGEAGKWLAGRSYGEKVGRCVAICAKLPPSAEFISVHSSVYAADPQFKGQWANCPGSHNTDPLHCYTPGFSGWEVPMHPNREGVCGVFKNWAHDRRVWVAVDVRYRAN